MNCIALDARVVLAAMVEAGCSDELVSTELEVAGMRKLLSGALGGCRNKAGGKIFRLRALIF